MKITNREMKIYNINGVEYEFVCESWETYRSWGHYVTLYRNSFNLAEEKRVYLNRTWEHYRYQSCMSGAVSNAMEGLIDREFADYKFRNGISRFRKGEKEKVLENIKTENERYIEYKKLYDYISNYSGMRTGVIE